MATTACIAQSARGELRRMSRNARANSAPSASVSESVVAEAWFAQYGLSGHRYW
jgi:hypothetical protein